MISISYRKGKKQVEQLVFYTETFTKPYDGCTYNKATFLLYLVIDHLLFSNTNAVLFIPDPVQNHMTGGSSLIHVQLVSILMSAVAVLAL